MYFESQARRDVFLDMADAGDLLNRYGYLSICLLQRSLRIGYIYASKMIDYLVSAGELYKTDDGKYLSYRIKP